MTNEQIESYLTALNADLSQDLIFLKQIGQNVYFAIVWDSEPKIRDNIYRKVWWDGRHEFFFIKNDLNQFIGGVEIRSNDLHWYITENWRKKGYLTRALMEYIIPFLFKRENDIY